MVEINPQMITDLDGAREAIRRLLNLVETLSADLRTAQEEIQQLRDENNHLKGELGKPDIKPNRQPSSESSPDHFFRSGAAGATRTCQTNQKRLYRHRSGGHTGGRTSDVAVGCG